MNRDRTMWNLRDRLNELHDKFASEHEINEATLLRLLSGEVHRRLNWQGRYSNCAPGRAVTQYYNGNGDREEVKICL